MNLVSKLPFVTAFPLPPSPQVLHYVKRKETLKGRCNGQEVFYLAGRKFRKMTFYDSICQLHCGKANKWIRIYLKLKRICTSSFEVRDGGGPVWRGKRGRDRGAVMDSSCAACRAVGNGGGRFDLGKRKGVEGVGRCSSFCLCFSLPKHILTDNKLD